MPRVAVGPRVDLPRVSLVRHGLDARGRPRSDLFLGARLASRSPGAEGAWSIHRGTRRAARGGRHPHARQSRGRSAPGGSDRRVRGSRVRASRRGEGSVHACALEDSLMSKVEINAPNLWRLETPGRAGWSRSARPGDPNKHFMISADCHANEPASLWAERIDAKYRERLPRVI